jgi:sugar phosphate isomerase/epimerase
VTDPQHQPVIDSPLALVASAASLRRNRAPTNAAFVRSMIHAVATAGFSAVSMSNRQHDWANADGMTSEEFLDLHRANHVRIVSSEVVLLDWQQADRDSVRLANIHLLEVAVRCGARNIIAIILAPKPTAAAPSDAGLGHLCELAGERDLQVSLEFVPGTGVPDLASAVNLIADVDADNLGLVLDTWHWFHQTGGPSTSTLDTIPAGRIHLLQLNDAPKRLDPHLLPDRDNRLLPGEGVIDILGLLDVLAHMGARPLVACEVFSATLPALGPAEHARRQFAAAKAVVDEHVRRCRAVSHVAESLP